jgi:hypothetical protein
MMLSSMGICETDLSIKSYFVYINIEARACTKLSKGFLILRVF